MFATTTCVRGGDRAVARALGVAVALATVLGAIAPAHGCDLCAIYTTTESREDQTGPYVGVGEQFSYFHTLQEGGVEVPNPNGERISSSITQFVMGYNVEPRIALQINLPLINRDFRRLTRDGIQNGDVFGVGDMSLLGLVKPWSYVDLDRVAHVVGFAGIKFPTGSTSFLAEEAAPPCIPFPDPNQCSPQSARLQLGVPLPPRLQAHHMIGVPSGVHGHDLTLGSGSYDGIVGAQLFGSWKRAFAAASVQYLIRSTGAYGYEFANDLLWAGGPGVYVLTGDSLFDAPYTLRVQALLTGESKGNDSLNGKTEGDTAITALYLGPMFAFAWSTHLNSEIGIDFPMLQNNSGLQIVPEYRARGGVTWRF